MLDYHFFDACSNVPVTITEKDGWSQSIQIPVCKKTYKYMDTLGILYQHQNENDNTICVIKHNGVIQAVILPHVKKQEVIFQNAKIKLRPYHNGTYDILLEQNNRYIYVPETARLQEHKNKDNTKDIKVITPELPKTSIPVDPLFIHNIISYGTAKFNREYMAAMKQNNR